MARAARRAGGEGWEGRLTLPCKQHMPKRGQVEEELVSFSLSQNLASQRVHTRSMAPQSKGVVAMGSLG